MFIFFVYSCDWPMNLLYKIIMIDLAMSDFLISKTWILTFLIVLSVINRLWIWVIPSAFFSFWVIIFLDLRFAIAKWVFFYYFDFFLIWCFALCLLRMFYHVGALLKIWEFQIFIWLWFVNQNEILNYANRW